LLKKLTKKLGFVKVDGKEVEKEVKRQIF
jgi:hypothetical protein